jgi:FkbH-like protein
MSAADSATGPRTIKCLVWDLDNTLWPGVAAEGPINEIPLPDRRMLDIIALLEKRGIVSSVASRNDPSLLDALRAQPLLEHRFVYPQVSWEPKSTSIRKIANRLNIGLDAMAFVDDSPFERAEVGYMLPEVLALSPEELEEALDSPAFNPTSPTQESEQRAAMYHQEEERKHAEESFGGKRVDFLRWCEMRLTISRAVHADMPRVVELTERTHQLNSTGRTYSREEIAALLVDARWLLPVARLTDRFGDYGMIGAALVDTCPPAVRDAWLVELIMLSCRVEGRGIPAALLRWIMGEAQRSGAMCLQAVYRIYERNLPIRLLFKQTGFVKVSDDVLITVARDLSKPLPDYPEWLHIVQSEGKDEAARAV